MKNRVAQYLLAAMAADAAFVARDQGHEYDALVTFGRIAASADRLAGLCEGEGECSPEITKKIRRFLNRTFFGADEWYERAFDAMLKGKPYAVPDHSAWRKAEFDAEYKKMYGTEPPDLGEPQQ